MDGKSLDIKNEKIEKLKVLMPEVFTEGDRIDVEKLRLTLGEDATIEDERYVLNWAGKGEAFKVLQRPTTATLAPDKKESVKFNKTENIFIEGENLEVLKVLQKSYFGKIKMIYIDPPYNTGNDSFIYLDKFSESKEDYLKRIGEKDEEGYMLKEGLFRKNSKDSGHYHSNWLSMMYPRLFIARNLLRDDGVIFVSIDDNEVHNLRIIMNEIFGEENFIGQIINKSNPRGSQEPTGVSTEHEYIICYAKTEEGSLSILGKERDEEDEGFTYTTDDGKKARLLGLRKRGGDWRRSDRPNMYYPFYINPENSKVSLVKDSIFKIKVYPIRPDGTESRWTWGKDTSLKRIDDLVAKEIKRNDEIEYDIYRIDKLEDESGKKKREKLKSIWDFKELNYQHARSYFKEMFGNSEIFDFPKPPELIIKLCESLDTKDGIIIDYFAGSGSTAQAIYKLNKEDGGNRKFILVQMTEKTKENSEAFKEGYKNIADICKERIRRVIKKIEDEKKNKPKLFEDKELDLGFKVFKLKHSNFKLWRGDVIENEEELAQQIEVFENPVKDGAKEENVLYELMLKSGYKLTSNVVKKNGYYLIADGELVIILSKLNESILKEIIKAKTKKCICLDSLFKNNDQLKTNTVLQMKDAGVEFKTV